MADFAAKTMIYRGLGSGIVRAMREDNHIDFDNEVSANQFKVTIWRTTPKDGLKDSDTIQKSNFTTQKKLDATQKKVLEYFKNNPTGTRIDAAKELGNITEDGVKFIIGKLQQKGLLKRVGGRRYGEWQVLINTSST